MRIWTTLLLGSMVTAAAPSWASALPANVPPTVDAGRQQLPEAPLPPVRLTQETPAMVSAAPDLDADTANQTVILTRVDFEGATAFGRRRLLQPFADLLGKDVSVEQIFQAVAGVQQIYLDAGYGLSRIDLPEQDISDGEIVINVIEGYVAEVDIDPSLAQSPLVQSIAHDISAMRPLNILRLERLLMLLAARPGLEAFSVLAPYEAGEAGAKPGAIKVILQPRPEKTKQGYVQIGNGGSNFLGPWQVQAGWRQGRVLGTDADVGVAIGLTPDSKELRQFSVDAQMPVLGSSGATARVSAGRTVTRPGENLTDLDVKGVSDRFGVSMVYPLVMQRDRRLDIAASFDYQNVGTDLLQQDIVDDRIRTVTLDATYNFYDQNGGNNTFRLEMRQGLDIMGARGKDSPNASRADGETAFTKISGGASRLQNIDGPFDAYIALDGQYSFDPLLSSEEFGYGGAGFGRGYDPSEIVGDHGISAMAELRYTFNPDVWPDAILQPFAFYDIGRVWNIDGDDMSGASAGAGMRFSLPSGTSGSAALAFPLTRPAGDPPKYSSATGPRLQMSVQQDF